MDLHKIVHNDLVRIKQFVLDADRHAIDGNVAGVRENLCGIENELDVLAEKLICSDICQKFCSHKKEVANGKD